MSLSDVAAFYAVQTQKADNWSTGTDNSSAIDTAGYHQAMVVFNAGTVGSSGTVDVKVQESDASGGTYTDVSGAAFTQVTASNDDTTYVGRVNLNGTKRFIRVVLTVGTAACDAGASVIMSPAYTGDGSTFSFEV